MHGELVHVCDLPVQALRWALGAGGDWAPFTIHHGGTGVAEVRVNGTAEFLDRAYLLICLRDGNYLGATEARQ